MPILSASLSVWELSFRWAGYDPRQNWFRLPLVVEDHARNLINAILAANLACENITLEKREFASDEKKFSVYYWLDDMRDCIYGRRFDRRLLRWAHIDRYDFKLWCERMNIPLPEFWFPPDWNLEYQLPENEVAPGHLHVCRDWTDEEWAGYRESRQTEGPFVAEVEAIAPPSAEDKLRPSQACRLACQQIASMLWRDDPDRTIASVVADELIQKYGGGSYYNDATVRDWVKVMAPPHVRDRRGRPPKNGASSD